MLSRYCCHSSKKRWDETLPSRRLSTRKNAMWMQAQTFLYFLVTYWPTHNIGQWVYLFLKCLVLSDQDLWITALYIREKLQILTFTTCLELMFFKTGYQNVCPIPQTGLAQDEEPLSLQCSFMRCYLNQHKPGTRRHCCGVTGSQIMLISIFLHSE